VFQSTYLFGAFSPVNGDSFLLELPFCSADTFQLYLNEFSLHNPTEFKIIVLDNGAFHKAKKLKIPSNIALIFLPPYNPELNPAERMWEIIKANFSGCLFKTLDQLSVFIANEINALNPQIITSACSYSYIFQDIIWTI
jgi:transposase